MLLVERAVLSKGKVLRGRPVRALGDSRFAFWCRDDACADGHALTLKSSQFDRNPEL